MDQIILASLLLFAAACHNVNPGYVETDKIHLLFGDGSESIRGNWVLDEKEKIIESPRLLRFSIRMDIKNVTWIEFSDVSAEDNTCIGWGYSWENHYNHASPYTIVTFTLNPTANINKIDFRMALPCAAFHQNFYYLIKVKSLEGNYFIRKKFPGKVIWHPGSES